MRRILVAGVIILALAGVLAGCGSQPAAPPAAATKAPAAAPTQAGASAAATKAPAAAGAPATGAPIKVAGLFGLTGTIATYGLADQRGVELGAAYVNEKGGVGGRPIAPEFVDFASDKAQLATQFKRLAGRDDLLAVLGPAWTAGLLGITDLIDTSGLPVMEVGSKAPWNGAFPKYLFRNTLVVPLAFPEALAQIHKKSPFKSLAVIYDSANEYQSFERDGATKAAKDLNVKVTAVEAIRTGDTDFSAVLTKIGQDPPDLLVLAAYTNEAGPIIQQARQRGIKSQIFGGVGLSDANVFKLSSGAADGALTVMAYNPDDTRPIAKEFRDRFTAKHNAAPDENNALAFDGVIILSEAMKAAGASLTRDSLFQALGKLKNVEGVNGKYSYNGNGDTTSSPFIVAKYANGKLVSAP